MIHSAHLLANWALFTFLSHERFISMPLCRWFRLWVRSLVCWSVGNLAFSAFLGDSYVTAPAQASFSFFHHNSYPPKSHLGSHVSGLGFFQGSSEIKSQMHSCITQGQYYSNSVDHLRQTSLQLGLAPRPSHLLSSCGHASL